jgi:hypothetical protein
MTNEIIEPTAVISAEEKLRHAVPFRLEKTAMPGVFTIPAPPADFDPRTARPSELIRAGFPWLRPDAGSDPAARALWDRVMAREWRRQETAPADGPPGRDHRRHHWRHRPLGRISDGPNVNTNWAGAVLTAGAFTTVLGSWQIPQISRPSEGAVFDEGFEGWEMSIWIGLGGYLPNNSNNLLQVGVTRQLLTNNGWGCFAWYEWLIIGNSAGPGVPVYTYQSVPLALTVNPGESVLCSTGYVLDRNGRPVGGHVFMGNETTGLYNPPVMLPVPSGADFSGGSAEWIVEAPDGGEWGSFGEPRSSLPAFTPVAFDATVACGTEGIFGPWTDPVGSIVQEITTAPTNGKQLTSTSVSDSGVTVTFTG